MLFEGWVIPATRREPTGMLSPSTVQPQRYSAITTAVAAVDRNADPGVGLASTNNQFFGIYGVCVPSGRNFFPGPSAAALVHRATLLPYRQSHCCCTV